MPGTDLLYRLALSCIPGIGPVYAKKLLERFGDAKAVFRASPSALGKLPGIGEWRIRKILHFDQFAILEEEIKFIEKHGIRCLFFTDKDYPQRLCSCKESPILFYFKGNADLNARRIVSIVGTRSPTNYGKQAVEHLIGELAVFEPVVVSGLALGIDAAAHDAALNHSLPTVAVLGHGLDQIYPPQNRPLATRIIKQGGLLTNFRPHQQTIVHNFPLRNRIVAGICDALVVVETDSDGGSMLTVKNALTYKKNIYAIPGRLNDRKSRGCNEIIREGTARLLIHASQIIADLGWDPSQKPPPPAPKLADKLSPDIEAQLDENEKAALRLLAEKQEFALDEISNQMKINSSFLAMTLLNLEFKGFIVPLPGKRYRLIG